jgi:hypothetical protein
MARSKFPPNMVRRVGDDDSDSRRMDSLVRTASRMARPYAESALNGEVGSAAKMVSADALALMGDLLKDEVRVDDHDFKEIERQIAQRLGDKTLAPDSEEIDRHAQAIGNALVRAWLTRMLDFSKTGSLGPRSILPRRATSEGGWAEVWDSVAAYNIGPSEAHTILRSLGGQILRGQIGHSVLLPKGLSLPTEALREAVDWTNTGVHAGGVPAGH